MNLKRSSHGKRLAPIVLVFVTLMFSCRSQNNSTMTCAIEVINELGFDGLKSPEELPLKFCPMIKKSCCKLTDQIKAYETWITQGWRNDLSQRFTEYTAVYTGFLDESIKIQKLANKVSAILKNKPKSNCKAYTDQFIQFDVKSVSSKLLEFTSSFYKQLSQAYDGVFCSVCDFENQKYFETSGKKQFIVSQEFCHQFMKSGIQYLIYYHSHMTHLVNLQLKFLNYCLDDNFKVSTLSASLLTPTLDATSIKECVKARNSQQWLEKCQKVCSNFNLLQINEYLHPLLNKFEESTKTLSGLHIKLEKKYKTDDSRPSVKLVRMLKDNGTTNAQPQTLSNPSTSQNTAQTKLKMPRDPMVFKLKTQSLRLGSFTSKIDQKGLDFFKYGNLTSWDSEHYSQLKSIADKNNGVVKPAQIAQISGMAGKSTTTSATKLGKSAGSLVATLMAAVGVYLIVLA